MEVFTIFLCIVIRHAFGDLQGAENGKDDLKARVDARDDLSPYVKEAINLDQYLQSKDAHLSAQSGSSNEIETDEKPSSPVMRSPLTASSYEVKKSGKKVYLETRVADIRSLLTHSDRNISAKKDSVKFRSFPVKSAAIRHTSKDFAIKKRRSFRTKRDVLDPQEPVFAGLHPKPNKTSVRSRAQQEQKNANYTKTENLVDVEKSLEHLDEPPSITHSGSSRASAASYSAMQYLLNKLPEVFKSKILITDDAEKVVLENYLKFQSVPTKNLDAYNSAKKDERELLKRLLTDVPIILPTYKSIRKGVAWNHKRLHDKFRQFFQKPSTALKQYEALKKDELASLDSFLASSGQSGAPRSTAHTARKIEEAEEAEKQKDEANAKSEEAEKRRKKAAEEDEDEDEDESEEDENVDTEEDDEGGQVSIEEGEEEGKEEREKRKKEENAKSEEAEKRRKKAAEEDEDEDEDESEEDANVDTGEDDEGGEVSIEEGEEEGKEEEGKNEKDEKEEKRKKRGRAGDGEKRNQRNQRKEKEEKKREKRRKQQKKVSMTRRYDRSF